MNLDYTTLHRHPEPAARASAADTEHGIPSSERMLLDALERALRAPRGKLAVALHLSRLRPPPRPYHARIALALMQDTAQRTGGQVFTMRNTDLVLLCTMPAPRTITAPIAVTMPASAAVAAGDVAGHMAGHASPPDLALPDALARLFGVDVPDAELVSVWRLEETAGAFTTYVADRQAEPLAGKGPAEAAAMSGALPGLITRIDATDLGVMLIQQTAVILRPGKGLAISARLSPLFREVLFSAASLQLGNDAAALEDGFIRLYVTAALEARVLDHVVNDLASGGALTRPTTLLGVPLHLNLSPAAIVSPPFARLAQLARSRAMKLAVQIQAAAAAADPALTAFARDILAQTGISLVLAGIDHAGLTMIDTAVLSPAMVKLTWSPRLAAGPASLLARVDTAITAIGAEHIVLCEADGEAAMVWAQSRGIARFQGPFMDAVQAAGRIAICHSARACTLRQCTVRALSVGHAARMGCGNPGLLDMPSSAPGVA